MPTPEEIILNSKHVPELPLETSASDTDYDVFYKTSTGKFSRILKSNSKGHITFSPVFLGTVTTSTETTSNSEIVTFINAQGFTISKGELKLLKVNVYIGSLIYTKQYLKIGNEVGTYGNSGTAITFSDLWEIESILVDENSPITTTVDLGDIGSDSVWDYINSTNSVDYELEGDSIYIFSATIDGVDYTYLYVGLQPQDLGDGNNAVDEDDFIQLTPNNENIGESSQRRPSVLSKASIDVAPPTENEGDRYLLYGSGTPNAGWDDQPTNTLVEFNGTSWVAETPKVGQTVYVINTDSNFQYKNTPSNGWYPYADEGGAGDMLKSLYDPAEKEEQVLTEGDKGAAGGVASLDSGGKVPASQLPSYVDDTIEGYLDSGTFYEDSSLTTPITGETGKVYIDLTSGANKSYRWTGSVYVRIDDISASEIKTLYESNSNTNALTDAALAKLNALKLTGSEETDSSIQLKTYLYKTYGQNAVRTGNIVLDDENCELGCSARVIHNDSTEPQFETNLQVVKNGVYVPNQRSDIFLFKSSETELFVSIISGSEVSTTSPLPTDFTLTGMVQNGNEFTSTTSSTWSSKAVSVDKMVGDGYIEYEYLSSINYPTLILLSANVPATFQEGNYGVFISGSNSLTRLTGSSYTDLGITPSVNMLIRLERIGSDVMIKTSIDGGSNYTTQYTWSSALTTNMYVCMFMNGDGKKIENVDIEL